MNTGTAINKKGGICLPHHDRRISGEAALTGDDFSCEPCPVHIHRFEKEDAREIEIDNGFADGGDP